jgi:hypothetical protein
VIAVTQAGAVMLKLDATKVLTITTAGNRLYMKVAAEGSSCCNMINTAYELHRLGLL